MPFYSRREYLGAVALPAMAGLVTGCLTLDNTDRNTPSPPIGIHIDNRFTEDRLVEIRLENNSNIAWEEEFEVKGYEKITRELDLQHTAYQVHTTVNTLGEDGDTFQDVAVWTWDGCAEEYITIIVRESQVFVLGCHKD